MNRLFVIVVILLSVSLPDAAWSYTGQSNARQSNARQSERCAAPKTPPTIIVHVQVREPVIDHALTRARLKQFQVATVSPYDDSHNVHVNGIMRGAISLGTQSSVAWQYTSDGNNNCFWFDQIEVTLGLSPTIYIAREIPQGSCLYKEVMLHEYKHFETDFRVAKDYQVILERELQNMTRRIGVLGPFTREVGMHPKKEMLTHLEKTVSAISDRMKQDRLNRQALLDTRTEYDRIATSCPDDMRRY